MPIVVHLQGIVQGRGGLILVSLILCTLLYILQFYLKRNRSSPPPISPSKSSNDLPKPDDSMPVSSRATAIVRFSDSTYYIGLKKGSEDPYHPSSNPDGMMQLGLADNKLSLDLLEDWLVANLQKSLLGEKRGDLSISGLVSYETFDGLMDLKIAMAGFMGQIMQGSVSFNPSQIILTAGSTPAIEALGFCLGDHGDAFLVPSPYYPGFDRDIKFRTGIQLIPVPCRSTNKFSLSIAALEREYTKARKRGVKVRAVLFSNPSNPVGNLMLRETLFDLLNFVTERNLHLISDEIYAGSIYGTEGFVSVAELLDTDDFDKSRVHIVYGLSKDLSLAGLRVGVIYSYNENVLTAVSKLTRFCAISTPTRRLLISMLSDAKFMGEYLKINRERLGKMFALFSEGLNQLGVECFESSAGFYCWVNMSKFLRSYDERGEMELWENLLNSAKVNITPGSSCHCIEPGWFRCCFATMTERDISVVIGRIGKVLRSHKAGR